MASFFFITWARHSFAEEFYDHVPAVFSDFANLRLTEISIATTASAGWPTLGRIVQPPPHSRPSSYQSRASSDQSRYFCGQALRSTYFPGIIGIRGSVSGLAHVRSTPLLYDCFPKLPILDTSAEAPLDG
jgi:hypothetical protein